MATKTVKLATYGAPPVELELIASGSILPGQCLRYYLDDKTVRRHNTAQGVFAPKLIAVESSRADVPVVVEENPLSSFYDDGDIVTVISARPGDLLSLTAIAGTYEVGDPLVVFTGNVRIPVIVGLVGSNVIMGRSMESKTLAALGRLIVEIS